MRFIILRLIYLLTHLLTYFKPGYYVQLIVIVGDACANIAAPHQC